MSSESSSVRYVPIGQDQVTGQHLKEIQIATASLILLTLLGIVFCWWLLDRYAKSILICKHCGGKLKPWSTKFSVCEDCGRRDDNQ